MSANLFLVIVDDNFLSVLYIFRGDGKELLKISPPPLMGIYVISWNNWSTVFSFLVFS